MTETILAIAILFSLFVLGGLISLGNERQRKAIDRISEQARAWAIEDLRLKRGQIEHSLSIEDPIAWLGAAASKALGREIQLTLVEVLENPRAISCINEASGEALFFSLLSPKELRALAKKKRSELSKRGAQHPLLPWRKEIAPIEMNILNAGIRFDIELPAVWQKMTKEKVIKENLWGYVLTI